MSQTTAERREARLKQAMELGERLETLLPEHHVDCGMNQHPRQERPCSCGALGIRLKESYLLHVRAGEYLEERPRKPSVTCDDPHHEERQRLLTEIRRLLDFPKEEATFAWLKTLFAECWAPTENDVDDIRPKRGLTLEEWNHLLSLIWGQEVKAEIASGFLTPNPCALLIDHPLQRHVMLIHPSQVPDEILKKLTGAKIEIEMRIQALMTLDHLSTMRNL